jgi:hypothetical protein
MRPGDEWDTDVDEDVDMRHRSPAMRSDVDA